jgi:hypothetical protein
MSFNEIVETLNRQGAHFSYKQVPKESFAGSFPGAAELAEMFSYWEAHTYLGANSPDRIALANKIAGRPEQVFDVGSSELPCAGTVTVFEISGAILGESLVIGMAPERKTGPYT